MMKTSTALLFWLILGLGAQTALSQDLAHRRALVKEMRAKARTQVAPPAAKTFSTAEPMAASLVTREEYPFDLIFFTSKGTMIISMDGLVARLEWDAPVEELAEIMREYVDTIREEGGILYAQGIDGIYRSTDDGKTWREVLDGFTVSLSSSSTTLAAGGFLGEVWVSTDKGNNWTLANAADTADTFFANEIAVHGSTIAYSAFIDPIRVSSDQGETWTNTGVDGAFLWSNASYIYTDQLAISGKLSRSTDGRRWNNYADHNLLLVQKLYEDERVRIVCDGSELEYQQAGGPWRSFTRAVGGETVNTFAIDPDGYLWVGTEEGSLWKSQDPVVATTGVGIEDELPLTIALHPAYPNPFNPSTAVPFEIRNPVHVTIRAFDVLGREVATLVDQSYPAGKHVARFEASHLKSGIYLIQMRAGGQTFTRTVTLLK